MALFACAATAISSVRAPAIPSAAKCSSAAARMRRANAGFSAFFRPRLIRFFSNAHPLHHFLRIAVACRSTARRTFLDASQIRRGKRNIECGEVFLEILALGRARNWNDVLALREHPG